MINYIIVELEFFIIKEVSVLLDGRVIVIVVLLVGVENLFLFDVELWNYVRSMGCFVLLPSLLVVRR
jgi:hypothetical protein